MFHVENTDKNVSDCKVQLQGTMHALQHVLRGYTDQKGVPSPHYYTVADHLGTFFSPMSRDTETEGQSINVCRRRAIFPLPNTQCFGTLSIHFYPVNG